MPFYSASDQISLFIKPPYPTSKRYILESPKRCDHFGLLKPYCPILVLTSSVVISFSFPFHLRAFSPGQTSTTNFSNLPFSGLSPPWLFHCWPAPCHCLDCSGATASSPDDSSFLNLLIQKETFTYILNHNWVATLHPQSQFEAFTYNSSDTYFLASQSFNRSLSVPGTSICVSLYPHRHWCQYYYVHLTDEETEAQEVEANFPRCNGSDHIWLSFLLSNPGSFH